MFRIASLLLAAALLTSCAKVARPGTLVISREDYDRLRADAALARTAPAQRAAELDRRADGQGDNELGYQASPAEQASAAHEKAVIAYAGVMLARRSTKLVASTELCMLEGRLAAARAALAREQQVAEVSGVLDEGAAHQAGVEIVELGERISDVREALHQSLGVAPGACSGGVAEAASCRMNPRICSHFRLHERAWDAATVVLSGDADVSEYLEERARQRLTEEGVTEAENLAASVAAELSR
jgi:hypothetical protein